MPVVVRGSGSIGQRHARVFRQEGADVALWPVRDRGLGPGAVDDVTGARLLDDATGPGALPGVLVVVATDTARHVSDTVVALDAGAASVLVEKPVAGSADDAAVLRSHPRAQDIWVAAPLRAHEAFRHLRRLVGRIDGPASAHVRSQSWLPDWRPDMVHEIDYAGVLFGRPDLVGGRLETSGPLDIEAEQAATLLWTTRDRFTVTARLDYVTRPTSRGVVIHTSDGILEWDVTRAMVRHTTSDGEVSEQVFEHDLDRDIVMGTQARAALELKPWSPAAQRIARGAPATLADGIDAVRLCDEARALASQGPNPDSDTEDGS